MDIPCYSALDFDKVPIRCYSTLGTPYTRWVPTGLPRISEQFRQCVFYLYKSREAAERGDGFGGTGFFVLLVSTHPPYHAHVHGVSNWHVAVSGGSSVIRVNTKDGTPDIFELDPSEWIFEPGGPDIAITPPLKLDPMRHKVRSLHDSMFITRSMIETKDIRAGEDVFMAGRFVDLDNGPTNEPALRFGNISVMPMPIKHKTGYVGHSYCIDLHSRSGFSGSPVFAYRTIGSDIAGTRPLDPSSPFQGLLGIHFGQFQEEWEMSLSDIHLVGPPRDESIFLDANNYKIKGLSGMTCVAPAWEISRILDHPEAVEMRKKLESETRQPPAPEPESEVSEESSDVRRDAVLRTMLDTPPEPKTKKPAK